LLDVFRRHAAPYVLLPLVVHATHPWFLVDDGGPSLRATRPDGHGDHDLEAWARILREYAELQRALESAAAIADLLAAGAPDGRPSVLPAELSRLLDDDVAWARLTPEEADDGAHARDRLRRALPTILAAARELAGSGIQPSIQHDDLHGGNILVGPAGDRIFDWGDGVVAHPFSTLTVTFNSIASKTQREAADPVFRLLRDAYLEAWADVGSRADLLRAVALARDFGCIGRALAWERALAGLEVDDMDGFGDSVAGWLVEFANRLDGPTWRS
jgi:aminoglycoside phosphotransferase (APT) family kinase protein